MEKVKHCSLDWTGLDIHAWVEYQIELGKPKKDFLIKDYDHLTESQRNTLLNMCSEAIEYNEDSIISHINDCISVYVSDNLKSLTKDLIKHNIVTK